MARPKKLKTGLKESLTMRLTEGERAFIETGRGFRSYSDFVRSILRPYVEAWSRGEHYSPILLATEPAESILPSSSKKLAPKKPQRLFAADPVRLLELQDPFNHFATWSGSKLDDPRPSLRSSVSSYLHGEGDHDAESVRHIWTARLTRYFEEAKQQVNADNSWQADARRLLLGKLAAICRFMIEALQLLDDRNPAMTGRAVLAMIDQSAGECP